MKLDIPEVVTNWIVKVRQTNDVFEQASPAQKRVMIAQDVLNAIDAHRITAYSGMFLPDIRNDSNHQRAIHNAKAVEAATYQLTGEAAVMPLYGDSCRVCAKGALFVAKLDRLNGVLLRQLNRDDPSHMLEDLFSRSQLDLIERAFEGWDSRHFRGGEVTDGREVTDGQSKDFAARFCGDEEDWSEDELDSDRRRMKKIVTNIVENGGTFDPTKALASKGSEA